MADESFKEDRNWHTTDELPSIDDVKTERDRYAYQRILRKKWDALRHQLPSAIMDLPFPDIDAPWWQHPNHPSPEQLQRQNQRYKNRILKS
jgi:hypothetical protein